MFLSLFLSFFSKNVLFFISFDNCQREPKCSRGCLPMRVAMCYFPLSMSVMSAVDIGRVLELFILFKYRVQFTCVFSRFKLMCVVFFLICCQFLIGICFDTTQVIFCSRQVYMIDACFCCVDWVKELCK